MKVPLFLTSILLVFLNIFFDLGGGGVGTVVVFTSPPCSPCFHWLKVRRI